MRTSIHARSRGVTRRSRIGCEPEAHELGVLRGLQLEREARAEGPQHRLALPGEDRLVVLLRCDPVAHDGRSLDGATAPDAVQEGPELSHRADGKAGVAAG